MKGIKPEWANLPRRKCANDGKSYKPTRPLRPGEVGFCCADCRKSYHKHGGAYRKLKAEVQKMVAKEFQDLQAVIQQCAQLRNEIDTIVQRVAQIGDALALSTPARQSNR